MAKNLQPWEILAGDTVEFYYYGRTNHGGRRLVKVETSDPDDGGLIKGIDLDKNAHRCYHWVKMSRSVLIDRPTNATTPMMVPISERKTMDFSIARQRLHDQIDTLNGEDLAEILAEVEGADKGEFIVSDGRNYVALEVTEENPVAHFRMNETDDTTDIEVVNREGEIAVVNGIVSDSGFVMLFDNEPVTPDEFAQKLSEHLG